MPAFEPSTWAEVEEAIISQKPSAQTGDAFVAQVRSFTSAPERFLTIPSPPSTPDLISQRASRVSDTGGASETRSSDAASSLESLSRDRDRRPFTRHKRSEVQFDDLLGHGRVDLDTEDLVRRYAVSANFEALNMFPEPSVRYLRSKLNPSCNAFVPAIYLNKVHHSSTMEQLAQGLSVLRAIREQLDEQADSYQSEKFINAALIEAAFENTKASLLPISPFGNDEEEPEELLFEQAEAILKARYEDVMSRESKLSRLQRSLAVFNRFQWLFTLGTRLKSAANEDVASIEEIVQEYQKAQKWLRAQNGAKIPVVSATIEAGLSVLFDALKNRLSNGHSSRQETASLVKLISNERRDDIITDALGARMAHAVEGLRKAAQGVDIGNVMAVRDTGRIEADVTDVVCRASTAFADGASHAWQLGRVLSLHDRWTREVHSQVEELCEAYAAILRNSLLSDVSLISALAVTVVSGVHTCVIYELQLPFECAQPVENAVSDVLEAFVVTLTRGVRIAMAQAAAQAVRADAVNGSCADVVSSVAIDTLTQLEKSVLGGERSLGAEARTREEEVSPHASIAGSPRVASSAEQLVKTCVEGPAIFATEIYARLERPKVDKEVTSLKVAICCGELFRVSIPRITARARQTRVVEERTIDKQTKTTLHTVNDVQQKARARHVSIVGGPLVEFARSLVCFPEDELVDTVSRTIPIKIEGVSKGAVELTLQLAMIVITTRRQSDSKELIEQILLELIRAVGSTIVDALSTDKLAYHRAAQLWVDVTFIQEMATKGANAESAVVQQSLDGVSRVKERAVQAVLADGFSFSLTDMKVLRETVVAGAIDEASMVYECFQETWKYLRTPSA